MILQYSRRSGVLFTFFPPHFTPPDKITSASSPHPSACTPSRRILLGFCASALAISPGSLHACILAFSNVCLSARRILCFELLFCSHSRAHSQHVVSHLFTCVSDCKHKTDSARNKRAVQTCTHKSRDTRRPISIIFGSPVIATESIPSHSRH